MFNQLHWPRIRTRKDYLKVFMLYKIIKGLVTITLPLNLTQIVSVTQGHSCRLGVLPSRVDCHLFSFLPSGIKLWNCLPSHIVEISSLDEFKRQLAIQMKLN